MYAFANGNQGLDARFGDSLTTWRPQNTFVEFNPVCAYFSVNSQRQQPVVHLHSLLFIFINIGDGSERSVVDLPVRGTSSQRQ